METLFLLTTTPPVCPYFMQPREAPFHPRHMLNYVPRSPHCRASYPVPPPGVFPPLNLPISSPVCGQFELKLPTSGSPPIVACVPSLEPFFRSLPYPPAWNKSGFPFKPSSLAEGLCSLIFAPRPLFPFRNRDRSTLSIRVSSYPATLLSPPPIPSFLMMACLPGDITLSC